MEFKDFGLNDGLIEGIEALGFEKTTPIQEQAIPVILEGKDLIASAQTGTGKTAAFLLPIINMISTEYQGDYLKALVVVPTRELALQIDQQLQGFSYFTQVSSIAAYGGTDGVSYSREKTAITGGVDILIATPGRLIAHFNMGYIDTSNLKFLVLDEADRMLDMGFLEDINKIVSFLPQKRQTLLFSATMPPKIRELAKKILDNPFEINISISKPAENILQIAYIVSEEQKLPLLKHIVKSQDLHSGIIFCSTKNNAKLLCKEIKSAGINAEEIHSDLEQSTREKVLNNFKQRTLKLLVATDIIARGIDIENIDLIINYDVPNDGEDYIHRIGRTARAEADGVAMTFVNQKEQGKFFRIEELLGSPVYKAKLPPEIGESPEYKPRHKSKAKRTFFNKGKKSERKPNNRNNNKKQ